ncbi:clostripain-related cysteine peptidase [Fusibacter sp. 3D3]|uniref:clostripain-related cysteine peptidase n=1 Tax=Fusibacter sp. 3D3 TaxID=1048380 RepID=UPI000855386A|nr:clostripain-related cysteine peptidase [Fusibacter sp. 3D3]GAU79215.1 clostripain [Fusibacter sp. 3D3]
MIKKKRLKWGALFLMSVLMFLLVACGGDASTSEASVVLNSANEIGETNQTKSVKQTTHETEWAIYWYLCGSDLESGGGSASIDLFELTEVELPENVKIIIQTGGASTWQNEFVDPNYIERYVYDSNGLVQVEQLPLTSMGDEETLSSFLSFAKTNYPADKTMFLFWNHGGGTVSGAASDELFQGDSLDLREMYSAFNANYELSEADQPFDIIGFDTCLMATVDVAYTFSDVGKYLVASQELEPSNGWNYTGMADALAHNPEMDAETFGKVICDTYQAGCEGVGTADDITLSLTDLSKLGALLGAYEDFGKEALASACAEPSFFSYFGRIAFATENYGGNTKEQGFSNMVDLGHLARQSSELLPETSENVLQALENCVTYKVSGPYRQESTGLSCYYSFNGDIDDFNGYADLGYGEAFKYYYQYGLTGELPESGMDFIAEMNYETIKPLETLENEGWENHELDVDSEGSAVLTLGENAANILSGIYIQLYYVDPELDLMLLLGRDNDLIGDWDTGVFKDNFRGVWGALDGNLVNMDISYEGEGYNLYAVPVLINGEDYNLNVIYDFQAEAFQIQGARRPVDESGMADKNLYTLIEGDIITTIHYAMSISGEDDELVPVEVDEIVWDNNMIFEEIDLGDGLFIQMFEMTDMQGNFAFSDAIMFESVDGVITTTVGFVE